MLVASSLVDLAEVDLDRVLGHRRRRGRRRARRRLGGRARRAGRPEPEPAVEPESDAGSWPTPSSRPSPRRRLLGVVGGLLARGLGLLGEAGGRERVLGGAQHAAALAPSSGVSAADTNVAGMPFGGRGLGVGGRGAGARGSWPAPSARRPARPPAATATGHSLRRQSALKGSSDDVHRRSVARRWWSSVVVEPGVPAVELLPVPVAAAVSRLGDDVGARADLGVQRRPAPSPGVSAMLSTRSRRPLTLILSPLT